MKNQLFSYFVNNTGALTMQDILLNFLIASVIGCVIFLSYRLCHSGASYSARFNVSLVMLTLVTTLVMNVIGNNIALSLGMVGALSIVRFRTAIKDPRDTAYIFWGIAVGICCGVSEYMTASIGTAVVFGMMLIFGFVRKNERFLLIVRAPRKSEEDIQHIMEERLKGYAQLRVINSTETTIEYIYELSEKMIKKLGGQNEITSVFYKNAEVSAVNLVCQNDEINR
ncbi:MAG: DUF4956 domain-containing protein [Lachnospiraceae bacterium]